MAAGRRASAPPGTEDGNYRVLIVDDQSDIPHDFREMLLPRWTTSTEDLAAAFLSEPQDNRSLLPAFELLSAMERIERSAVVGRATRDGGGRDAGGSRTAGDTPRALRMREQRDAGRPRAGHQSRHPAPQAEECDLIAAS